MEIFLLAAALIISMLTVDLKSKSKSDSDDEVEDKL